MNPDNLSLRWLGAVSLSLFLFAGVFWFIGIVEQAAAFDAGLPQFAIAETLLHGGAIAGMLWLASRGIVAQLAYDPTPVSTLADVQKEAGERSV